jgi:DNA-directed RNA polymerase specialized sigma24 family protein
MALLNARWQLLDVDDVEALLARAISRSRVVGRLRPHEREDLLAELLVVAWRLADRFDPARGKFATALYAASQRRCVNWVRRERGRTVWKFGDGTTYERTLPQLVALDERDSMGAVDAGGSGDRAAAGAASLGGLLGERGGDPDRDIALLRRLAA